MIGFDFSITSEWVAKQAEQAMVNGEDETTLTGDHVRGDKDYYQRFPTHKSTDVQARTSLGRRINILSPLGNALTARLRDR